MGTEFIYPLREAIANCVGRAARRYHLSRQDEEDFAQDTWLFFLQHGESKVRSCRDPERVEGFLWRLVSNRCIDWCHAHGVWRTPESAPLDGLDVPDAGHGLTEAEEIELGQLLSTLDLHRQRLSIETRAILTLRYDDNRSVKDIAAMMGMTPGAVSTRISRALDYLRKALYETMTPEERDRHPALKEGRKEGRKEGTARVIADGATMARSSRLVRRYYADIPRPTPTTCAPHFVSSPSPA